MNRIALLILPFIISCTYMKMPPPSQQLPLALPTNDLLAREAPRSGTQDAAAFERDYQRLFLCPEGERHGMYCSPLVYPFAVSRSAPVAYLAMGEQFESTNDFGGAAIAYWSAATLVSNSV